MSPTTTASEQQATQPPFGHDMEKFASDSGTDSLERPQRRFSAEAERAAVRKLDRRVVGRNLRLLFVFRIQFVLRSFRRSLAPRSRQLN